MDHQHIQDELRGPARELHPDDALVGEQHTLDDESAQVRGAAAGAVSQLIGVWKGDFKADDPPEKRKQEAARIRECWKKYSAVKLKVWQKCLEEKDAKP